MPSLPTIQASSHAANMNMPPERLPFRAGISTITLQRCCGPGMAHMPASMKDMGIRPTNQAKTLPHGLLTRSARGGADGPRRGVRGARRKAATCGRPCRGGAQRDALRVPARGAGRAPLPRRSGRRRNGGAHADDAAWRVGASAARRAAKRSELPMPRPHEPTHPITAGVGGSAAPVHATLNACARGTRHAGAGRGATAAVRDLSPGEANPQTALTAGESLARRAARRGGATPRRAYQQKGGLAQGVCLCTSCCSDSGGGGVITRRACPDAARCGHDGEPAASRWSHCAIGASGGMGEDLGAFASSDWPSGAAAAHSQPLSGGPHNKYTWQDVSKAGRGGFSRSLARSLINEGSAPLHAAQHSAHVLAPGPGQMGRAAGDRRRAHVVVGPAGFRQRSPKIRLSHVHVRDDHFRDCARNAAWAHRGEEGRWHHAARWFSLAASKLYGTSVAAWKAR
eukprot:364840-Chlamydomonas_euryale.AAC.14